jgi:hypothetical protein
MRMAGDQLAALAHPHMAALARPGATEGEVIESMIALSEVMRQENAFTGFTVEDAIRDPRTPPGERVVLIQLMEQLKQDGALPGS